MNQQDLYSALRDNDLFDRLSDEQLSELLSISEVVSFPKNAHIFREGEVEEDVYLILKGGVDVTKKDHDTGKVKKLAVLGAGDLIGEMALIDQSPRSASIQAAEYSVLLSIPIGKLSALSQHVIIKNISKQLTRRLRNTNDLIIKTMHSDVEGAKIRVEMEKFMFIVLIVLAAWIFFSSLVSRYITQIKHTGEISSPVIFFISLACLYQVKQSSYPLSLYGITLNHWKKYALEGIVFSIPFLLAATLVKVVMVNYVEAFRGEPVLSLGIHSTASFITPWIYVLFTPLQEFIARGCFQSSIQASLTGTRKTIRAIFLSSLLFAAFHTFVSPELALVAFIFSLFWGWLYERQKSLVGCSVSHALIGGWCLSALDYYSFLRGS